MNNEIPNKIKPNDKYIAILKNENNVKKYATNNGNGIANKRKIENLNKNLACLLITMETIDTKSTHPFPFIKQIKSFLFFLLKNQ